MLNRWVAACGVGLLTAVAAAAQGVPPAPVAPSDCLDQPTQLPPLLRPPCTDPNPPLAVVPRGPVCEYDHGQFYLPDYTPPSARAPESCRPLGRWWVEPALELAWVPTRAPRADVRLRVPVTPFGDTIAGPVLPTAGRTPDQFQPGFALNFGRWFDDDNTRGIDFGFSTIGPSDQTFAGFAPAMLVLFPNGTNGSAPQLVVFPPGTPIVGIFPATLSSWFITADVNYRQNLYCGPNVRLDALVGYRFAFLQDELFIGETPDGPRDDHRRNRVAVSNPFHGGQLGLAGEYRGECWYVGGSAKVALGVVTPDVSASGLFLGAEGATGAGGFARLAALTDQSKSFFAVMPGFDVKLGRQLGEHARLFVGYSFQYLSRVSRLGDVLDPAATRLPLTTFWVQSVNLGFELRY
jgi:Putative beta barrel porin-7 (BBP7)